MMNINYILRVASININIYNIIILAFGQYNLKNKK